MSELIPASLASRFSNSVDDWLDAAASAAREAGAALQAGHHVWRAADCEVGRDIKLRADREAESLILAALRRTGLPVLSEEAGAGSNFAGADWAWVVDPLDGTFNYQRGFPLWCVSIGLICRSEPVLGVIFDPNRNMVVQGAIGRGTSEAGHPLRVTTTIATDHAALATGFPVGRDYHPESIAGFVSQVREFKKIRMLGSAATSLLAVARGQFDAYYEESISLWDVVAGAALVRAAGGEARLTKPESGYRFTVYAGNGRFRPKFLSSL